MDTLEHYKKLEFEMPIKFEDLPRDIVEAIIRDWLVTNSQGID
jgi:hypothetical protein